MTYRTILIPLDGSELCHQAVEAALPLAKALGARVVLCSAFDCAPERFGIYDDSPIPGEFKKEVRAHHDAALNRAHQHLLSQGIETATMISEGDHPIDLIVERAKQENADLIVMASHGRTGVPRFFMGSVTDGVLRRASCPVLVVRPSPETP